MLLTIQSLPFVLPLICQMRPKATPLLYFLPTPLSVSLPLRPHSPTVPFAPGSKFSEEGLCHAEIRVGGEGGELEDVIRPAGTWSHRTSVDNEPLARTYLHVVTMQTTKEQVCLPGPSPCLTQLPHLLLLCGRSAPRGKLPEGGKGRGRTGGEKKGEGTVMVRRSRNYFQYVKSSETSLTMPIQPHLPSTAPPCPCPPHGSATH